MSGRVDLQKNRVASRINPFLFRIKKLDSSQVRLENSNPFYHVYSLFYFHVNIHKLTLSLSPSPYYNLSRSIHMSFLCILNVSKTTFFPFQQATNHVIFKFLVWLVSWFKYFFSKIFLTGQVMCYPCRVRLTYKKIRSHHGSTHFYFG